MLSGWHMVSTESLSAHGGHGRCYSLSSVPPRSLFYWGEGDLHVKPGASLWLPSSRIDFFFLNKQMCNMNRTETADLGIGRPSF